MFTGLVEALANVADIQDEVAGRRITLAGVDWLAALPVGDSLAINGCCLTVIRQDPRGTTFEAGRETLSKTVLGALRPGDRVNIERALAVGGRLGGHLVQGHVDGIARIRSIAEEGPWRTIWFDAEPWVGHMVPKGSIAVDGVSLTIVETDGSGFSVALIPHTIEQTTLGDKGVGDSVHLELDIIGKYVRQAVEHYLGRERS